MRAFLGILAGIVVALAVQSGLDYLSNSLYPPPVTDMWNRAQLAEAFSARPTNALLITIAGYFLGGLIGGVLGKMIWRRPAAAWTSGGVLGVMALIIGFSFPVPTWFLAGSFGASLIGALLANHLVKSGPATLSGDAVDPIDGEGSSVGNG